MFAKVDTLVRFDRYNSPPIFTNIDINTRWIFALSMALPLNDCILCILGLK